MEIPVSPPPTLDTTYTPPSNLTFEVVISHYDEPLSALATSLIALLSLPQLQGTVPLITLYTKHPTTPLSLLATALSLPISNIHRLPNHGREGGTYLHHILQNWSHLAAHTLFIQTSTQLPSSQTWPVNPSGRKPVTAGLKKSFKRWRR